MKLDPAYLRFRAELRKATDIDPFAYAEWLRERTPQLSAGYALSDSDDASTWLREQFQRSRQGVLR